MEIVQEFIGSSTLLRAYGKGGDQLCPRQMVYCG